MRASAALAGRDASIARVLQVGWEGQLSESIRKVWNWF